MDMPKSSFDLPKSKLFIKLATNTTRFYRNILRNNLLNYVNDDSLVAFDGQSFVDDINQSMKLLDIFNAIISVICFSLGLFQLIVTISANIRDSMWELGVLRSIGMTKNEITRLVIYESICNNLSSIILGFIIGLFIAISLIGQFLLFLELPFKLVLPYHTFILVAVMSMVTMALGSYIGTFSLNKKQIASVLKGI
jgi:ABC-type antimicrobial peptide transport system permease subunit